MRIRFLICALALGSTSASWATQEYLDAFLKHYKLAETSHLSGAQCAICHVSTEDFAFNPYGKTVKAKGQAPGDALFASLESEDADGDGKSNGDEIKGDTLPGNPAEGGDAAKAQSAPVEKKAEEGLVPKTGFHPAIVHFPIGLFIAGLLLDLIGLIKKETKLLYAGWYNVVLAAITSVAAVASGFYAMTNLGFPMKGNMANHLYFTIGATFAMWIMVALRVHRHEQMNLGMRVVYYLLAAATLLGLSWAGHLGGVVAGTA